MTAGHRFESTASLLAEVKAGSDVARERLCALYLPLLMRWAHGRLPRRARALSETSDLVQSTLMQALARVGEFESRHEGAFLAYLRNALLNNVRNEIRRGVRHPSVSGEEHEELADQSPLADQVGRETLIDYERALANLSPERREAVILRIEFGFSFDEIAAAMERPSAPAARMLVGRGLAQLAEAMR
jgi:RNA polymerase sigma-70 factor (ECF subfamily)